MKKLLLIGILLILIFQPSFGQFEEHFTKGNILTGGNLQVYSEKELDLPRGIGPLPGVTYTTNRKSFETGLIIGYFFIDQLVLGIKNELLFSCYKTMSGLTSEIISNKKNSDLLIGPFIRYYTKSRVFFEGSAGIGILSYTSHDDKLKGKKYYWCAGVGYSLFLSKSVAFEPVISYNYLNKNFDEIKETYKSKKLNFSIGFQIYLFVKNEQRQ